MHLDRTSLSASGVFFSMPCGDIYLHGFLLQNYLPLEISFQCLEDLTARRVRWRVVFDRTGKMENLMHASWSAGEEPQLVDIYRHLVSSIRHHITHVAFCIQRDHPWRALYYLDQLRERAVKLVGLRQGLETHHYRQLDVMDAGFLAWVEDTLACSLAPSEIQRALRTATLCFFQEA